MKENYHNSASAASPNPLSPVAPWKVVAGSMAWITGLFCALMVVLLLVNHYQGRASDPLLSPKLAELKAELAKNPGDETLKKEIRQYDLVLRQAYLRYVTLANQGAWLLFGGAILFLISAKYAFHRDKMPRPLKVADPAQALRQTTLRAQFSVGILAVAMGGIAWYYSQRNGSVLSLAMAQANQAAEAQKAASAPAPEPKTPYASEEELEANWPRFRGPGGLGIARSTNTPVQWDVPSGKGVLWKTEVPLFGPNSPVIWDNRLFITGATAKKREVYCYDTSTGKLLWQKSLDKLPGTPAEEPTVMEDSGGYSAPTAATDGRRVYAIFANGDLGAWDMQGKPVWTRSLGLLDNGYGHATSLDVDQNRLYVLLDQGGSPKDNKSKLLALNVLTGETLWESPTRPVPNSWTTPIHIEVGQKTQIITCANPWVISYDPANGQEIWRAKVLYGETTPSPIFAAGLVYSVMEGEALTAIRPNGTGDVTQTHVVWKGEDGLPDITSPLSDGQRVFLITTHGTMTCYQAADGKKLWEHELELGFQASPSLSGNRIYLFSDKGPVILVEAADSFKELGRSEMGEEVLASPAFLHDKIFVRGKKHLICLGQK